MRRLLVLLGLLTLAACAEIEGGQQVVFEPAPISDGAFGGSSLERIDTGRGAVATQPPAIRPSDAAAANFAIAFLDTIQPRSVRLRAELCGFFYIAPDGSIAATPPRTGTFAGCEMPVPQAGQNIFASYHTHSAYAPGYDNEVPSAQDLLSDFDFGLDGYVSAPGGRIWHVDYGTRTTRQVCGIGCVYMDPGFVPEGEASIRQVFTVADLQRRNAGY